MRHRKICNVLQSPVHVNFCQLKQIIVDRNGWPDGRKNFAWSIHFVVRCLFVWKTKEKEKKKTTMSTKTIRRKRNQEKKVIGKDSSSNHEDEEKENKSALLLLLLLFFSVVDGASVIHTGPPFDIAACTPVAIYICFFEFYIL